MIEFETYTLDNGLEVILAPDSSTQLAAVNLLYRTGSRNEDPDHTGLAHLFEHLMFSGTKLVPEFDTILQQAGGDNNAFTTQDITQFYEVVPAQNLELALMLEADRMVHLNINAKSLKTQKDVVVEEFKETCLNVPYGNLWHILQDMVYPNHPYRWPVIGLEPDHIQHVTLEYVRNFYASYYHVNNAILTVSGKFETEQCKHWIQDLFGGLKGQTRTPLHIPVEKKAITPQRKIQQGQVPLNALYLAFRSPGRIQEGYHASDLLSDLLSNGQSSRLFASLVKEKSIFQQIDCYITGNIDEGLFIIEGKPQPHISMEAAEAAIWKEIELLLNQGISDLEMEKLINKNESATAFSNANILNIGMNLSFYAHLGDAHLVNSEVEIYRSITASQLQGMARNILDRSKVFVLEYLV